MVNKRQILLRIIPLVLFLYCTTLRAEPISVSAQEEISEKTPENDMPKLTMWDAVVFGIVEGVTEYLPVSSTGHLIIAKGWMGYNNEDEFDQALNSYLIVIQLGAILAVFILYWRQLTSILFGFIGLSPSGFLLGRNLIISFIPSAVIGLLLHDLIKSTLFGVAPVVMALIAGAILMIWVETYMKKYRAMHGGDSHGFYQGGAHLHQLTVIQCLQIGFLQCFAMWPGTSRSMMTIVGGYWVGLTPARAAEYSFLLGLVTLSAASGYEFVSDGAIMLKHLSIGPTLMGILIAGIFAAISIKFFVSYLSRKGLKMFAYYRILLAFVVLFFS